jgi:hypothetical protein
MNKALVVAVIYVPYMLLAYEALVSPFVNRSDQNSASQSMIMTREVNAGYTRYLTDGGYQDILDNFTVDSSAPFNLSNSL